jgi:hypothetical protein
VHNHAATHHDPPGNAHASTRLTATWQASGEEKTLKLLILNDLLESWHQVCNL